MRPSQCIWKSDSLGGWRVSNGLTHALFVSDRRLGRLEVTDLVSFGILNTANAHHADHDRHLRSVEILADIADEML